MNLQQELKMFKSVLKENTKLYNDLGGWGSDDEHLTQEQLDNKDDYITNILRAELDIEEIKEEIKEENTPSN